MVAVLVSQLACSTSNPVPTLSPDAQGAARLSDAGFIDPSVAVFRDANLQLPDVIGVNGEGACRTGRTAGTVCAPNGSVVAGARISASTTTCEGEPRIIETDANIMGYFSLDGLAPGWTEVTITTGTFVAQFAVEIEAGVVLKGTHGGVDGIYSDDPRTNPDAVKLDHVSYMRVLNEGLKVMDSTAITLCMDNDLPIVVFDLMGDNNLQSLLRGESVGTLVDDEE